MRALVTQYYRYEPRVVSTFQVGPHPMVSGCTIAIQTKIIRNDDLKFPSLYTHFDTSYT